MSGESLNYNIRLFKIAPVFFKVFNSLRNSNYLIAMNLKLSQYHVVTPSFFDRTEQRVKRIVFASRTSQIRIIDDNCWKIITDGAFERLGLEILKELKHVGLLVSKDENELTSVLNDNDKAANNSQSLYRVIQPTAYCQLGCHYCGQEHRRKSLDEKAQDLLVKRIAQQLKAKEYNRLSIGWFGAEPLVGLSVIRKLTPRLRGLAKTLGCEYQAKIVTNGLALTDKIATELVNELKVNAIEITLDGLAEAHDARRFKKNGKPTFDKIFANTLSLAKREDLNVKLSIRCNVDRQNYLSVSPLLQLLAQHGLQENIGFYIAPIHSWGNDAHTKSLSKQEFANWEIERMSEMIQLGFKPALIPKRKPVVCMAVQPQSELIDADGNIFNCSEVSYVPTYGEPNKYAIDHLSGKKMPGEREILGNFNQKIRRHQLQCASCPMLPVCGGACPKQWTEGREPCPSTKYNIQQKLLLSYAVSRISQATVSEEKTQVVHTF